ncbi:MAG: glutamate synthase-related protein, partial [bacterium]|nr:glutamate synthase-related protein [bacterium]MDT8367282.1 glutamate synthase-related protein [bacterium]
MQCASGRFGIDLDYFNDASVVEIKIDDFAKSHQCAPRGAPKSMTHSVSH